MVIRKYQNIDSLVVEDLIKNTLCNINNKDYPNDIIEKMCKHFTAERMNENALSRDIYVAIINNKIVGTVSIKENNIHCFFVDHNFINTGIGTELLKFVEEKLLKYGYKEIFVPSSITSEYFYKKKGFSVIKITESVFGKNIIMKKILG